MNEERWTPEYYDGVDYVVVSTTFSGRFGPDELREYIDFIQGLGIRKIIVIGQFIHLREDLLVTLPKAGTLHNLVTTYSDDASATMPKSPGSVRRRVASSSIKRISLPMKPAGSSRPRESPSPGIGGT